MDLTVNVSMLMKNKSELDSAAGYLEEAKTGIAKVQEHLAIDGNSGTEIAYSLKKINEALEEEKVNLKKLAQASSEIARLYAGTEEGLIDEGITMKKERI